MKTGKTKKLLTNKPPNPFSCLHLHRYFPVAILSAFLSENTNIIHLPSL